MGYRYLVLGAGMQGTAAAYDLAVHGEAGEVMLADKDIRTAQAAAERVNRLAGRQVAQAVALDVTDEHALQKAMAGCTVTLSAVPYRFNLGITRAAIAAGTSLCDLGGNTDIVLQQLVMDEGARQAGVTILPDCGFMPGMGNVLIAHGIRQLDRCERVDSWDGGLPVHPRGPFRYKLVFSIEGLINEYAGDCVVLRNGRRTRVPCLSELEEIEFPSPVGKVEAFITGGGISTLPWTFEGQVQHMRNKTVRYPGHCQMFIAYRELGLFREDPIEFQGQRIVPRHLLFAMLKPLIDFPDDPEDLVVMRVRCSGEKAGRRASVTYELMEFYDPTTGFTAMERATGFPAALAMTLIARGKLAPGARPAEIAVPMEDFLAGLGERGIHVRQWWEMG
ncbi:MAG: saccharopine dehydrogenase family protein [Anaerolineae bacterium]